MSQFDIHKNAGENAIAIPFVVVVQSAALDGLNQEADAIIGALDEVFSRAYG